MEQQFIALAGWKRIKGNMAEGCPQEKKFKSGAPNSKIFHRVHCRVPGSRLVVVAKPDERRVVVQDHVFLPPNFAEQFFLKEIIQFVMSFTLTNSRSFNACL